MIPITVWIFLLVNLIKLPSAWSQEEIACPKGFVIYGEKSYLRDDSEAIFCLVCKTNSAFAEIVEVCQDLGFFANLRFKAVVNTAWIKAKPEGFMSHKLSCEDPGWAGTNESGQDVYQCDPLNTKTGLKFDINRNFTDLTQLLQSRVYVTDKNIEREIQVFGYKALSCPSQEKIKRIFVTFTKGQRLAELRLCIKCESFLICTSNMLLYGQPSTDLAFSYSLEDHFLGTDLSNGVCGITYDHENILETLMDSINYLKCLHPQLLLSDLEPPNVITTLIVIGGAFLCTFFVIGIAIVVSKIMSKHKYLSNFSNTLHGIEPERRATWIPKWKLASKKAKRNTYFAPSRPASERSEDYDYYSEYETDSATYLSARLNI